MTEIPIASSHKLTKAKRSSPTLNQDGLKLLKWLQIKCSSWERASPSSSTAVCCKEMFSISGIADVSMVCSLAGIHCTTACSFPAGLYLGLIAEGQLLVIELLWSSVNSEADAPAVNDFDWLDAWNSAWEIVLNLFSWISDSKSLQTCSKFASLFSRFSNWICCMRPDIWLFK